jgi:hypothetical protein
MPRARRNDPTKDSAAKGGSRGRKEDGKGAERPARRGLVIGPTAGGPDVEVTWRRSARSSKQP